MAVISDVQGGANVSTNKTLAEGDCGIAQRVTATCTITLPATVVGYRYTILNAADEAVTITVSPNASDKIMGLGFTSADDKDAINTLGQAGDFISLVGDGANGWVVDSYNGTWARQT